MADFPQTLPCYRGVISRMKLIPGTLKLCINSKVFQIRFQSEGMLGQNIGSFMIMMCLVMAVVRPCLTVTYISRY